MTDYSQFPKSQLKKRLNQLNKSLAFQHGILNKTYGGLNEEGEKRVKDTIVKISQDIAEIESVLSKEDKG